MATNRLKVKDRREVEEDAAPRLMLRQAVDLFSDETERQEFIDAIRAHDAKEQSIIILKDRPEIKTFPRLSAASWQPDFIYRIGEHFRASKHPLYKQGAYYSLDLSSVFSASSMLSIKKTPQRILDLCASPGGKAVFAYRAFSPDVLMCNETVRKRALPLIANLDRCGCKNSIVWSADPSVYAKKFPAQFDLVICDAPCSGQSLIAKGDKAVGAFNPDMIDMCHSRQRRIVGNAIRTVAPGGHLLYATCTYSRQENEKIIAWLLKEYPHVKAVEVPALAEYQSRYADFPCYRLHPTHGYGAGAFVALVQNTDPASEDVVLEPLPTWQELPAMWRFGDAKPERLVKLQEEEAEARAAKAVPEKVTPPKTGSAPKPALKPRRKSKKPSDQGRRRKKRW